MSKAKKNHPLRVKFFQAYEKAQNNIIYGEVIYGIVAATFLEIYGEEPFKDYHAFRCFRRHHISLGHNLNMQKRKI